MSMKYSRSVFTSVAIFSSCTSICLLGKKLSIKYSLGLVDWLCVCAARTVQIKTLMLFFNFFFAYVKLDHNVTETLLL